MVEKKILVDEEKKTALKKSIEDNEVYTFQNSVNQKQTVKEAIRQKEYEKQMQLKAEISQMNREDDKEKAKRMWSQIYQKSMEMSKVKGQQSYIEFTTSIMDLLEVYALLTEAIFYSHPIKNTGRLIWQKTLEGTVADQLLQQFKFKISDGITDIKEAIKGKPQLEYEIAFDNDGVLQTRISLNGKELSDDLKVHFDSGIVVWLENNGYIFDQKKGTLKDAQNKPITIDKFYQLNQNPETSMSAFFSKNFNLGVKPSAVPTPRLTPNS